MPDFSPVEWNTPIEKLVKGKKDSKIFLLELEEKIIPKAVKTAQSNHEVWAGFATKTKNAAKIALETVESAFAKLSGDSDEEPEELLKEISETHFRLANMFTEVKQTNERYAGAFGDDGFRGNTLKEKLASLKAFENYPEKEVDNLLKPVKVAREPIISGDRGLLAERNRIEEYFERADAILKAAKVLSSSVKQEKSKFLESFAEIETSFQGEHGFDRTIERLDQKLEQAYDAAKKGNQDLYQGKLKLGEDELPAMRKNLAGAAKTATIQLQSLKAAYGKKLYARFKISSMEKRMTKLLEEVKLRGARVETFDKTMKELREKSGL